MKKLLLALFVLLAFTVPNVAQAKGFSGGHSSFSSHSITSHRSTGTYHSGYKSPSSNVNRNNSSYNHSNSYNQPSRAKSFATHAAAFGAGALLGSMFHPFGGGGYSYGGGYGNGGVPFLGILIDVLIVVVIIWIIRRIFGGRRRY
jgi:predicted lipid-binding transport protein (Tim44 family)